MRKATRYIVETFIQLDAFNCKWQFDSIHDRRVAAKERRRVIEYNAARYREAVLVRIRKVKRRK